MYPGPRCISCCASRPSGFSYGIQPLPGQSVYHPAAYSTHSTRALTGANFKLGGQQIGLEKYKFHNDTLHARPKKKSHLYITTKYAVLYYQNLDN